MAQLSGSIVFNLCAKKKWHYACYFVGKWTPFKELLHVVSSALTERQPASYYDLEAQLTKHKPNLISLLQHAVSS